MITPELEAIRRELWPRYHNSTLITWGIYNRRRIAGSTSWSQHAWGNAEDVSSPASAGLAHRMFLLDGVYRWLIAERDRGRLPIGTVLWRVRDHFDHIHYEAKPKRRGTPPAAGEGSQDMLDIIAQLGDSGTWVKPFQAALNRQVRLADAAGFGAQWPPALTVDGRYGALTAAMVAQYQRASGSPVVKAGAIDSRLAVLLCREML